jgi:hypothetical protein
MAGYTLLQAQTQLDAWMAASLAVVSGQRYMINGRELWRVNAAEIRQQIDYWNQQVTLLTYQQQGRSRSRTVVPG